ncbi:MAG TPA: hypothetical protein VKF62_06080, partial [Planctomycetota bacterium]|nr:hypothetical protein [Planctomycetota bacterium]
MLDVRRVGAFLIASAPLLGCGTVNPKCGPALGSEAEAQGVGCAGPDEERIALCDGSSSLRFAATVAGGNLGGVPRVAAEVGWSFLLID